jgi:hypothetical protein
VPLGAKENKLLARAAVRRTSCRWIFSRSTSNRHREQDTSADTEGENLDALFKAAEASDDVLAGR